MNVHMPVLGRVLDASLKGARIGIEGEVMAAPAIAFGADDAALGDFMERATPLVRDEWRVIDVRVGRVGGEIVGHWPPSPSAALTLSIVSASKPFRDGSDL